MNRVVRSGPSTDGTARSWQELLRSIASKGEKMFAAGAQGVPEERSQRPVPPLGRGQPPSGGQPLTAPTSRFCDYAVASIGVARLAWRKPRKASMPRNNPAITIA